MRVLLARLDNRVGRNAAVKLVSELVARTASFALVLLVARRLGEESFGLYNYGIALGFVLAQLADLGLQMLVTREVAQHGYGATSTVRAALALKGALSLVVLAALLALTAAYLPPVRLALVGLGLAMLAQTYLEFAAYVFRGQQRLQVEAELLAGARLATALLGALVLWMGGQLLGLALSQLVAAALMVIWAFYRLRSAGWLRGAEPSLPRREWPLLRQSLPLGIAIFFSIAYTRLAVLLLQLRGGELLVADFSAALRLVEPTQILPASLVAAVFPAYAHALFADPAGARRLARRVFRLLGALGLLGALAFWLLAPWLIPFLYGAPYRTSVLVFQILGLSIIPAFVNYSLTHYLIACGRQALLGLFNGGMLLLHAALSWMLIPHLGAAGPAISVVAAELLLFICCLGALRLAAPSLDHDVQTPEPADAEPTGTPVAL